ncbi:hypothetical protein D910_07945 [Dendroctonus ponderosae]|uniref:Uncharacterized protein n=2 Tax=Dendroctonus ponderosae TaxID=77166 RepID=U4UE46_DENPD|nr:hypothetical protein D910_07945 [Dendroctonus ponderosae]
MRDVQHQQTARRLAADLEEKFRSAFAAPERFPRPPPYRNVVKSYSNKQVGGKQQAPLPPPPPKAWSSTSAC